MDEDHPPSITSVGNLSTFIYSDVGLAIGHLSCWQRLRPVPSRPVGIGGVRGVGTPDRVSTQNQSPAMSLHNLLKVYVYSQQEQKAVGLALKICNMNPQSWKNNINWHLTQGPTPMKKWILSQDKDVLLC